MRRARVAPGGPQLSALAVELISWNLHGVPTAPRVTRRMRAAASEIRRRAPDFALLQEVWRRQDADLIHHDLGPLWLRVDTDPGAGLGRAGGLLAFASRARGWRLVEARFERFRAHGPRWRFWEGDGLGEKGFQELELERAGARIALLNTHLQASYAPGGYAGVRRAQLRQLREALARVDGGLPLLAAGDLNTRPDEPIFGELARAVVDLTAELRGRCGCGTSVRSGGWIDYLLARRGDGWRASAEVELIRSPRPDWPFSDHHALAARVSLEPNARAASPWDALHGPSTRRAWLAAALRLLASGRARAGEG